MVGIELGSLYTSGDIDIEGLAQALENPSFLLLIARLGDRLAGYLHGCLLDRVDGRRMLLVYDVEVGADHRRQGVATALIQEVRRLARANAAEETWLVTEDDNVQAIALYESLDGTPFAAVGYEWSEG